jgi:hypothetical protein
MTVNDVRTDFKDGVKLLTLLEIAGGEPMRKKWHTAPAGVRRRSQELENANLAIEYMTRNMGIRLVGISAEHIVDGNERMTLGLVWSIINKFVVENIFFEERTGRDAVLIWCKTNTAGYPCVNIANFESSWVNGLGWAALLHRFRPNLLDYYALNPESADKNYHLATTVAVWDCFKQLGIATLLDPEDVVGPLNDATFLPDEKSVITQLSELYYFFASDTK